MSDSDIIVEEDAVGMCIRAAEVDEIIPDGPQVLASDHWPKIGLSLIAGTER